MLSPDRSSDFLTVQSLGLVFPGPLRALEQLTLQVPRGQFLSIVGPSGCGKSTLLRLIAGLLTPSEGRVLVNGQPPAAARRTAVRMSYVFQDPTLLPWRTVSGNVSLPLELGSRNGNRASGRTQALIEQGLRLVDLESFANRFPGELSGGMRMRVSLARALVTQPELLLMDEPFGALDDISRQRLNEELLNLWAQHGWTVIFVTHNISEAVFLSQRLLVMGPRPGRIVADIPVPFDRQRTADLRANPEFARLAGEVSSCLRRACA